MMEKKIIEQTPILIVDLLMYDMIYHIYVVKYDSELDNKGFCSYPGLGAAYIYVSLSLDWELTLMHELYHLFEYWHVGYNQVLDFEVRTHLASKFSMWSKQWLSLNELLLKEIVKLSPTLFVEKAD